MGIYTKTASGWVEIEGSGGGELPGIGGWATVTAVQAPTTDIPAYTDSEGVTWKAWSWENPRVMTSGNVVAATRDLIGSITEMM